MNELKDYITDNSINNVLIVGDTNYYEDSNVEVEMISKNKPDCLRLINDKQFLNKNKRLIYYKYKNIIIEQEYIYLLAELKYYFEDHELNLWIILDKDFLIEEDDLLMSLLEDKKFKIDLIEIDNYLLMRVRNEQC